MGQKFGTKFFTTSTNARIHLLAQPLGNHPKRSNQISNKPLCYNDLYSVLYYKNIPSTYQQI